MLATAVRPFTGRRWEAKAFYGVLLLLVLVATRWAWIDCDGGTPSLTEYGYFATDEGFYAGGGKQKLIYGMFINATRMAPCTYAICPSTHVLTWIAFELFGQNTWAHRVFPLLVNTTAWLCLYFFFCRKTLPWIAFLLCAVCLLNPFMMVYGRTSCNDSLMAALLLIGYVVARRRGLASAVAGGAILGLGLWVKMSIWLLSLLGFGAAAISVNARERWRRVLGFAAGFAASALVQYALIRLMIYGDAVAQSMSVDSLLSTSNSSYPIPNPFDWEQTFRGISSFPRFPTGALLGVTIPLFIVLPALLLLRRLAERPVRWDGRLLLYAAPPLYAAGVMILPVYYAHYFIPLVAFIPVLWYEARRDLKRWGGQEGWLGWMLLAAALAYVMLSFKSFEIEDHEKHTLNAFLANAYNLPKRVFWASNGIFILAASVMLTAFGLWVRRRSLTLPVIAAVALSALGVADLCYCRIPLTEAHKYTRIFPETMVDIAYLLMVGSIALFFVVWVFPGTCRRSVRWYLVLVAFAVGGALANPRWRKGFPELLERGHLHRKAVEEVSRLVPDNAVVFGERAPQLFLSLKARVAPCPNCDPVPVVLKVHEKNPDRPLFALLDAEHNYHYSHYMQNKERIGLRVLHTLKLPSFNDGKPCDVFLVRLTVLPPPKHGPLVR